MTGRPPGPKRQAAMEQLKQMREQGRTDAEIRQALLLGGLTRQQVRDLLPEPDPVKVEPPKPDDEAKRAVLEGAAHFLDSIAKRISPNAVDRFTELGTVKFDALSWARKVRGVL